MDLDFQANRHCASLLSGFCFYGTFCNSRKGAKRNDGSFVPEQFLIRSKVQAGTCGPGRYGSNVLGNVNCFEYGVYFLDPIFIPIFGVPPVQLHDPYFIRR